MPTPPGFADMSVQLTLTGFTRPAYITFGVDPTATDPVQVCDAVSGTIQLPNSLLSILDAQVTVSQIRCSLGTDGGEDLVGQTNPGHIGTSNVSAVPPNCAVLVHKSTSRGGRRGRGRLFIPWAVSETNVEESGLITTATVNTMQTAMNNWLTGMATAQVPMVLLHGQGITAPGAPNLVTTLTVDKLISTQRRRLGR